MEFAKSSFDTAHGVHVNIGGNYRVVDDDDDDSGGKQRESTRKVSNLRFSWQAYELASLRKKKRKEKRKKENDIKKKTTAS